MARLELLRHYRWSSYPAYVGRAEQPEWLTTASVLRFLGRGTNRSCRLYGQYVEQAVMEDVYQDLWQHLRGQVVLGGEDFIQQIQGLLRGDKEEQKGLRQLRSRPTWSEVVAAVEELKGEKWESFRDRHGDWGRDAVLWLARRHAGLRLRDLGELTGGLAYHSVSRAVRNLELAREEDQKIASFLKRAEKMIMTKIQI